VRIRGILPVVCFGCVLFAFVGDWFHAGYEREPVSWESLAFILGGIGAAFLSALLPRPWGMKK